MHGMLQQIVGIFNKSINSDIYEAKYSTILII